MSLPQKNDSDNDNNQCYSELHSYISGTPNLHLSNFRFIFLRYAFHTFRPHTLIDHYECK